MNEKKIVIIGGVAAGTKIASRAKRILKKSKITIIEKGQFISYAGCGLPYFISDVVKGSKELMSTPTGNVRDASFFKNVKGIEVLNRAEAISIDRENKNVTVKFLETGEIKNIPYDILSITTGATPFKPPISGIDIPNVFSLQTIEDAEAIKKVALSGVRNATIIGGGLIGVEMAEAFGNLGLNVTLLEKLPQILSLLDEDMAKIVEKHMQEKGVKILTNVTVKAFVGDKKLEKIITDKEEIKSDIAIVAIGVKPNVKIAKEAGIEIGKSGAIKVNEKMQTSDKNIYAAGDCVESFHLVTKKEVFIPLGSTANKQGRVAANNICGIEDTFKGVLGSAICKVFDFNVSKTGLSEREALNENFDTTIVLSPAADKPHFYPNSKPIFIKLVVCKKTRRLLGSQIVGLGDVTARIQVAVTAISAKMTVDDISHLDLAYAPPYSPAMDNIITAADIARNKLDGVFKAKKPKEVKKKIDNRDDFIMLDVRSEKEHSEMSIQEAKLMPLGEIRKRCNELPLDKEIVAFCKISLRGYEASKILEKKGYKNVKVMDGGILSWPYKIEKSEK